MITETKLRDTHFGIEVLKAIGEFPLSRHAIDYFDAPDRADLSADARIVLKSFNWSMRLRMPFDGSDPSLVGDRYAADGWREVKVRREVAEELIASRSLYEITEEDIPLVQVATDHWTGGRGGWKSAGLDGTKAKFYCAVV